jgi:pyruvate kinase
MATAGSSGLLSAAVATATASLADAVRTAAIVAYTLSGTTAARVAH